MIRPLFAPIDTFVRKGLDALPAALDAALPQSAAQRRELPYACRDLSLLLTSDRKQRDRPYWASPRLTAAYLRYFLPWNLVRLVSLLPALPLDKSPDQPLIVDMGSGPLTFPLALWLARPELRAKPVTVLCTDLSPHALNLGKQIFTTLTTSLSAQSREECPPWTIHTLRTPLTKALRQVRGRPWLITLGNVLNELEDSRQGNVGQIETSLSRLLTDADRLLLPEGFLLTVEPGTRQGGRMISTLRTQALTPADSDNDYLDDYLDNDNDDDMDDMDDAGAQDYQMERPHAGERAGFGTIESPARKPGRIGEPSPFKPLAPCTHCQACPMTGRGNGQWCHVNSPVAMAPAFLRTLSQQAGMDKESVSLAFLLLSRKEAAPLAPQHHWARLISEPFVLPGYQGRARYACTDQGLALVIDCAYVAPGSLTPVELLPHQGAPLRDHKSQALLVALPGRAPKLQPSPMENAYTRPRPDFKSGKAQGQMRSHDAPPESRQRPDYQPNTRQDRTPDVRPDKPQYIQPDKPQSMRPDKPQYIQPDKPQYIQPDKSQDVRPDKPLYIQPDKHQSPAQPSGTGPAPARSSHGPKAGGKKTKKSSVPPKPFWA